MVKRLLSGDLPASSARSSLTPQAGPRLQANGQLFRPRKLLGNIDLAVLRPENQNPTHVTALIDKLAEGLFRERLVVVGPPPRRPDAVQLARMQRQKKLKLLRYLTEDRKITKKIVFPGKEQLKGIYWKAVSVDDEVYRVSRGAG